jgi:hypothetical protein
MITRSVSLKEVEMTCMKEQFIKAYIGKDKQKTIRKVKNGLDL